MRSWVPLLWLVRSVDFIVFGFAEATFFLKGSLICYLVLAFIRWMLQQGMNTGHGCSDRSGAFRRNFEANDTRRHIWLRRGILLQPIRIAKYSSSLQSLIRMSIIARTAMKCNGEETALVSLYRVCKIRRLLSFRICACLIKYPFAPLSPPSRLQLRSNGKSKTEDPVMSKSLWLRQRRSVS